MIDRVDEGEGVVQGGGVVRALLTAIATLEDLVEVGDDSHLALSTLEDIADELGRMDPDERRRFIGALEHVASQEPSRADWIRGVPQSLGLDH
ncbi:MULTISPECIES: hypothetical protein [unclassified Streptomyces]|uniref:hypothetical protein n=1 Tax=Streptomyces TaxID=1883 RepID=UPI00224F2AD1|nr:MULTISPECIES: hypothetical protein [unclassified Streptomyces]MCX4404472.1 hypothetical protein [Streptomyces sp. NBC_01764]MCX5181276.1 hypothetical protein [Streptomyces sp. NBC_00268]MCX5189021.1 hypothetical protein [Streptomyces sp. NBC_00268]MCX5191759.1 hypothetical protein [Streptomyces sp. NBC_00268]